jgi:hypothetical protein
MKNCPCQFYQASAFKKQSATLVTSLMHVEEFTDFNFILKMTDWNH